MRPIVFIKWNDAVLRSELNDSATVAHEPVQLHSVGFLLKSDEIGVSFCTDYDPAGDTMREQSFIPRGMIVEEITLGAQCLKIPKPSRRKK